MLRFIRPRARMESILLVDENPLRASIRKSILEGNAPGVVRVQDAFEALCMVESPEFARGLMLVITGHTLAGITGPDFVAELRSRLPHVPVLVLSGLPSSAAEYQDISDVSVSSGSSPDELRALVHQLVDVGQRQTA